MSGLLFSRSIEVDELIERCRLVDTNRTCRDSLTMSAHRATQTWPDLLLARPGRE